MKDEDIKKLLEKYYEGNTSQQEDQLLKEFFSTGSPAGFETESEIFMHYSAMNAYTEPDAGFESRIMQRIEEAERPTAGIKRYLIPLATAAASVIIIAGSWFLFSQRYERTDTFGDPAIAYSETMKILYSVSVQMNRGAEAMEPVSRFDAITRRSIDAISESSSTIDKSLRILSKDYDRQDEKGKNK